MYRDCGWVRISAQHTEGMLGRGHLYLRDQPPYRGQYSWEGKLNSIRLQAGAVPLSTGYYLLHFESGPDVLTVRLDRHRQTEPGAYTAGVQSAADNLVPLALVEQAAS